MKHPSFKVLAYLLFCVSLAPTVFAQKGRPSRVVTLQLVAKVPSISEQMREGTFIDGYESKEDEEMNPKHRGANKTVPGKGYPKTGDPLVAFQKAVKKSYDSSPLLVFDADISQASPSDPTGAVGPNHFLAAWNTAFRIFDKQGNPLTREASLSTIFPGNAIGDPIVLYDASADRFIITEFDKEPNGLNIAISTGPDPVNDGWYIYTTGFETGSFPDYTKFSIWRDGYYITANIPLNDSDSTGDAVFVIERDKVLKGESAQFLSFPLTGLVKTNFYSPQVLNVGYPGMPQTGGATVVYMQDDAWANVNIDHLKLWTVNVDWQDPLQSNISEPQVIPTAAFTSVFDGGGLSNLKQSQGPDIDVLQATIMNQAQFRAFDSYNSAVFNFVVDVAEGDEELAGIRWFELRQQPNKPWNIYQEGTYVSPEGINTFAGSMIMDKNGAIGLGYTTMNDKNPITIKYTGRYKNDPLNIMSVPEGIIAQSSNYNASTRYADYTHMTLDPIDEESFWFISEYFNPERRDVAAVFKLAPSFKNDLQITSIVTPGDSKLSKTEKIKVKIRNAGLNSQSNFNVSYSIDGSDPIVEKYSDVPLAFNESAEFTFIKTADLSVEGEKYIISAQTELAADQNNSNDSIKKEVKSLWRKDIGISSIDYPTNSSGLTQAEKITATITNYGWETQKNFPISFTVNNKDSITEIFTGLIESGISESYTSNATFDFSGIGIYNINVKTGLNADGDIENDAITSVIENNYCSPQANCSTYNDGVTQIQLNELLIDTECNSSGFADETQTIFE
ncbi:MAG: CARDB domain-containing protein, partial [Leeuwenhoekiella sp.]